MVMVESINTPVIEKTITMAFHLCEALHNKSLLPDITHNATVDDVIEYNTKQLSIIFLVPGTDKGIDKEKSPLKAIRQVNVMIKSLTNKITSVKVIPWIGNLTKEEAFLTEFPEDLDIAEKYNYDFNRFYSPGDRG